MASVLTKGSTVTCAQQGTATLTTTAKLHVAGDPVLRESDAPSWSIKGCKLTNPSGTNTPCAKLASVSAGQAMKLTSDGSPVLLDSFQALTMSPPPSHSVSASDAKSKMTAS